MPNASIDDLRQMLVENCMLKVSPEEIQGETPLFGPDSVGLDSLDALQLTVAVEKSYGIPIQDPATARQVFTNLNSLQHWLSHQ
jgi:acyl carrier protein